MRHGCWAGGATLRAGKDEGYVMLSHFSVTSVPSFTAGLSSLGAASGWYCEVLVTRNCGEANGSCAAWIYVCISEKGKKEFLKEKRGKSKAEQKKLFGPVGRISYWNYI